MDSSSFQCSCCGETLDGPAMAWHFEAPEPWLALSPRDRERRGELTSDQCVIDDEQFFLRGLIEIPVVDSEEPFGWGVWVSLSRANFDRASDLWESPSRVEEPAYFGWLCNEIPGYPSTLHLKAAVHSRAVGLRPFVELDATDQLLAMEQRNGVTMARVREIAEYMHHRPDFA